jgi:hypothetical protein
MDAPLSSRGLGSTLEEGQRMRPAYWLRTTTPMSFVSEATGDLSSSSPEGAS